MNQKQNLNKELFVSDNYLQSSEARSFGVWISRRSPILVEQQPDGWQGWLVWRQARQPPQDRLWRLRRPIFFRTSQTVRVTMPTLIFLNCFLQLPFHLQKCKNKRILVFSFFVRTSSGFLIAGRRLEFEDRAADVSRAIL